MKKVVGLLFAVLAVLLLAVSCQVGESADEALVLGRGIYTEEDFAAWVNKGGYAFLRNDLILQDGYLFGYDETGNKVTTPYQLDLRGHKLIFDSSVATKDAGVEKAKAKKPVKAKVTVSESVTLAISNTDPENTGNGGIESNKDPNNPDDKGTVFDVKGGDLKLEDAPVSTDGGGDPVIKVSDGGNLDVDGGGISAGGGEKDKDGNPLQGNDPSPALEVQATKKDQQTDDQGGDQDKEDKKSTINLNDTEITSWTTPVAITPPEGTDPEEFDPNDYEIPEVNFGGTSKVENSDPTTDKSPIDNQVGADVNFDEEAKIVIPENGNCPQEEKSGENTRKGGYYRMKNAPALIVSGKTELTLENYTIVSTYDADHEMRPTIVVDGTSNDSNTPTKLILDGCLVIGEGTAIEVKGNAVLETKGLTTNINVQNDASEEFTALNEKGGKTSSTAYKTAGILLSQVDKSVPEANLSNVNIHVGEMIDSKSTTGYTVDGQAHYLYGGIPNVGISAIGGKVVLGVDVKITNAATAIQLEAELL